MLLEANEKMVMYMHGYLDDFTKRELWLINALIDAYSSKSESQCKILDDERCDAMAIAMAEEDEDQD